MGIDRSFNRNQQKSELQKVLGKIQADNHAAAEIQQQTGGVHLFEKPKQVPTDPDAVAAMFGCIPGAEVKRPEELPALLKPDPQRQYDSTPRVRPDGQIVCADIGDPPPGCLLPTHLKMGGVIYFLIPPGDFEDTIQEAFERGWQSAWKWDCDTNHNSGCCDCEPVPSADPNELAYKLRVIANEFGDFPDADDRPEPE